MEDWGRQTIMRSIMFQMKRSIQAIENGISLDIRHLFFSNVIKHGHFDSISSTLICRRLLCLDAVSV